MPVINNTSISFSNRTYLNYFIYDQDTVYKVFIHNCRKVIKYYYSCINSQHVTSVNVHTLKNYYAITSSNLPLMLSLYPCYQIGFCTTQTSQPQSYLFIASHHNIVLIVSEYLCLHTTRVKIY